MMFGEITRYIGAYNDVTKREGYVMIAIVVIVIVIWIYPQGIIEIINTYSRSIIE